MRKFTLFLALMVTMVTSAFAQGSEVIDIASNADAMLYSNAPCKVTTWGDDFKGWHVLFDDDASTFFHSDYSGDDSVDGLDHYWRVDMGEGNSVSLFTFTFTTRNTNSNVNSPTTIVVEGSNEADGTYTEIATLTGLPTTNSTVYNSETLGSEDVAYRYIRYRVTDTESHQTKGGHIFFFIAEFGMSKVKAGAVLANINYTYTYNGETIGSATASAYVGDAYPEPANVPFGYHAATPEGTVEGDKDITIECTLKLPFEYAESVDAIETWYYMQMHSNNKKYIQYVEGASSLEWADAEVAEGEEDSYTWAFVGTPATGFKLVNRAAGTELAVCSDGSNDPALGAFADAVNWTPAASDIPGEAYFCLQYPGSSNYMNAQNGKVAYWNDNDAGSTLLLTEREITAVEPEPEAVTFDIYALDDSMNPSPLEGTVSKLGFVVFAASDNNAVLAEAADAPKVCIFDPAIGGAVAEASGIMFGDLLSNGMQLVAVQFDGFSTPGTYMVYAPAGAFTVNGKPSEEIISAQFTIAAPAAKVFEIESVTPANGAEVEAIEKIEIKFTEDIILSQDPATWDFYTVNLVDENNNVIKLTTSDDANVWSKAVFTPAEPITAAGTYTLDLSQIKLEGGVCEGSFSWTVKATVVEPEPEVPTVDGLVVGLNNVPTEITNPAEIETGYYLLKQVNADAAGSGDLGYIKADYENVNSAVSIATKAPTAGANNEATYVWYVEKADDGSITIATANKKAYWQAPWQNQKNLAAEPSALGIVTESVTLGGKTATPTEGSAMISNNNPDNLSLVHYSGRKLGSWNDANPASVWFVEFYEVSVEDLNVLSEVDITYNYTHNGETVKTETFTVAKGTAMPAVTLPYGVATQTVLPETATETATYEIICELDLAQLPFAPAASYGEIEKWYHMTIHANEPDYLYYAEGQEYIPLNVESLPEENLDAYAWAFVGNPFTGYQIVNKLAGEGKILSSANPDGNDGNTFPILVDATAVPAGNNTHWDVSTSTFAENGFFIAQHGTNYRMNNRENKLAYWTGGADAGSTFLVTEVAGVEPVALAVVSQTPAADEVVESFNSITIEFNKAIEFIQAAGGTDGTGGTNGTDATGGTNGTTGGTDGTGGTGGTSGPAQYIKLKDANNGVVATAWVSAATIDGNKVTFVFEMNATITNPGTYTFTIPAGLIKATDGEEFAGETFTFEVSVPEGIEDVDAEVENDVIYDLSGRRIVEITKSGIYIINGKKVLVK